MADVNIYGNCECGAPLEPIFFREKEYKVVNGHMTYTGRSKDAVSHLICEYCGRKYPVDNTFDGPWEHD